ncbi:MAG: TIGR03960 family B12-binding radical SAM protein [Nitrospirae bacterium]|nr:TIGR03960 family B12-binding radical SAM protein [Nitrospirota bacterium]
MNLSLFQKPSRYINSEVNSLRKEGEVRVALAFPDIYDVGMSHLGLKILYKIINDLPYASAERAFHPWLDLEKEMKYKGILLSSLETERPLKDFDIVGFSFQYELSYTTVLNMLHLAGIPIRSEHRAEGKWPLVIAGGPCTVNPMPMSPFIDAFLIGDAEEAIVEILDTYRIWKKEGDAKKESLFKALSSIEGIYVPFVRNSASSTPSLVAHCSSLIKRRYIESLDNFPYPESPVVPYTQIVHDRVNIEVSRGCTMGCRFCQAGMIYRPLRERSPEKALSIAEKSLKNTGHEEVSFTSLSAGDYSCLLPLLKAFNCRFLDRKISLSLPSLRVAAVSQDVLKEIKSVRKTGFTIAPEAATGRLRNVINKDFTEEDYERSLKMLFEEGWQKLKLYFMVGLPTETQEDIEAIPDMALKALKIAKKHTNRYVTINITLSPFVPKPHTPFQWYGQENIGRIKEKLNFLKNMLQRKKLMAKAHNEEMSLLEAVFARGDEKLSNLIEEAWSSGCILDPWTESFDFNKWAGAMEKTGIDASAYAEKTYAKDEPLPWDIIDTGIKKEYLYKEYQKAISAEITTDCKKTCHACGLECKEAKSEKLKGKSFNAPNSQLLTLNSQLSSLHIRVEFSKTGKLKYLSHFELVTAITRAMRRIDIPLVYSAGFHPSPRISFGPALGVGISGIKEYFDMEIKQPFDINYLLSELNSVLPEGLKLRDCALISAKEPSLSSFISRYEYEIICPDSSVAKQFSEKEETDIREMIEDIKVMDKKTVRLILVDRESKKVRLGELLPEIFNVPYGELDITRLAMYGWKSRWSMPLGIGPQQPEGASHG